MKNKIPKERVIYSNYDVSELFEYAKQSLIDNGNEDPSDNEVWDEYYFLNELNWENMKTQLNEFFKEINYIGFFGEIGRWNGVYKAGKIDKDFWKLFDKAITDCDYIKIYDENGHMYLTATHHDGSVHFEIKEITERGYEYLQNWEDSWGDKRSEEYIHNQIYNHYSRLPRFAERIFGDPAREYEPTTKSGLKRLIQNQARSFYC